MDRLGSSDDEDPNPVPLADDVRFVCVLSEISIIASTGFDVLAPPPPPQPPEQDRTTGPWRSLSSLQSGRERSKVGLELSFRSRPSIQPFLSICREEIHNL